jgi:RNA polymerase sigma factor (sigma-70 family)
MRLAPSIVLLRTQTDERLTALAAEGSEPAFTALVERYRRLVLRACMRVLPESRAEDATQQVFVSAWKALTRGDEVRAVRPWLLRIARNTALNALRTPGYEYDELAESLSGGSAPQAELERREVVRQTLRGLADLPENQREALLRTAVQGASHADIARDLGITEGATRQLVLRARATLRSAASAVTPLPLLNWAANGAGPGIAEIAAGGSTAGVALLAKAGAVAVIAGGAAATPTIVHEVRGDKPESARAAERTPPAEGDTQQARSTPIVAKAAADAEATVTPEARRRRRHDRADDGPQRGKRRHRGRHRNRGHGPNSGPGRGHADDDETTDETSGEDTRGPGGDSGDRGNSGPGKGGGKDDGNSGPGKGGWNRPEDDDGVDDVDDNSGSGKGKAEPDEPEQDNSGKGGSGGDDDAEEPTPAPTAAPLITPTPTPDEDDDDSGKGGDEDEEELSA